MEQRHTFHLQDWRKIKINRDYWWTEHQRQKEGQNQPFIAPPPEVGTDVVGQADVVLQAGQFRSVETRPQHSDDDTE